MEKYFKLPSELEYIPIEETTPKNRLEISKSSVSQKLDSEKASVERDLKEMNAIEDDANSINEYYDSMIEKEHSLWFKMTNPNMAKLVSQERKKLVSHSGQFRMKFYHALMETRLQMFEERCNAHIKCVHAQYRRQVASFLLEKFEELVSDIRMRKRRFMDSMKDDHVYAESLKSLEGSYVRYNTSLVDTEIRFFRIMDQLLDSFESATQSTISKYEG